eukprot:9226482-Pyramimonas_sp.AAC.1
MAGGHGGDRIPRRKPPGAEHRVFDTGAAVVHKRDMFRHRGCSRTQKGYVPPPGLQSYTKGVCSAIGAAVVHKR